MQIINQGRMVLQGDREVNSLEAQAIAKAEQFKEQLGGTIFAFPIEETKPFSSYAVVMYAGGKYFTYPDATNISEASAGVLAILKELEKRGLDADYERNVRIISYQAQMDAPSTVMHQLKKEHISRPLFTEVEDFAEGSESISARGLLKMSYILMNDKKNLKASRFMDEYYKLLATRKYGKTAAAIKQEVRKMGKGKAIEWLEQTYKKYVHDDMELIGILDSLGGKTE